MADERAPRVVHRDDALLILDKPSGLSTTAPHDGDSLTRRAERIDASAEHLHPTSRLDAEVTGLVTFARTREANQALLAARREGDYRRLYLGIGVRAPDPPSGTWDAPIALDPDDKRLRRAVEAGARAKGKREAQTDYEVAQAAAHGVLLALRPKTGRTHQLRVHAAAAGVPLVGDVRYGGDKRVVLPNGRVVTARRVMLHCFRLELPDVARGRGHLHLEAPIPPDFLRVWRALGGTPPTQGDSPL